MLKRTAFWILVAMLASSMVAQEASERIPDPEKKLVVTLHTDKSVYHVGETMQLQVQLLNVGSNAAWISSELAIGLAPGCRPGGLWIEAKDSSRKVVHGNHVLIADCAAPIGEPMFVRLSKDQFFGVKGEQSLEQTVPGLGQYSLVMHYGGPIKENASPQPRQIIPARSLYQDVASAPVIIRVIAHKQGR